MVKQTRYELLKDVRNKGLFTPLVSSGCISINLATWVTYYEDYLKELKGNDKPTSIQYVADLHKITTRHLYNIINFFE